jgi:hypothetical protein
MSHHVELRDLSPRQRKALEDCVSASEELIELDYEIGANELEPAEQEEE